MSTPTLVPHPLTTPHRAEHRGLRAELSKLEGLPDAELQPTLKELRARVEASLVAKDQMLAQAAQSLESKGQAGQARILRIFEQNMGLMSQSLRAFLDSLDGNDAQRLRSRLPTFVRVLQERMDTEEKAVFPLIERSVQ